MAAPSCTWRRRTAYHVAFLYPETFAIEGGGFTDLSGIDAPTPEDIVSNRYNGYSFIIPSSSDFITDCDWLLVSSQPIGECTEQYSGDYLGCGRFDQLEYNPRCQDAIDAHDIPGVIVSIVSLLLALIVCGGGYTRMGPGVSPAPAILPQLLLPQDRNPMLPAHHS